MRLTDFLDDEVGCQARLRDPSSSLAAAVQLGWSSNANYFRLGVTRSRPSVSLSDPAVRVESHSHGVLVLSFSRFHGHSMVTQMYVAHVINESNDRALFFLHMYTEIVQGRDRQSVQQQILQELRGRR